MDSSSLEQQIVVVTGASSGIGLAIARALSAAGAVVVLTARRMDLLREAASALPRAIAIECDVTSESDVTKLFEAVSGEFGRIDGLVNNAGVASWSPLVDVELRDWQRMLDVNVTGSFLCARAVLPSMTARRSGWIVNVCSDVSKRVFPGGGAYCASKFAQYALSLALGAEGRQHGIRVGAVLPGVVGTELAGAKPADRAEWVLRPSDVAEAVLFMATRPPHAVIDEITVHPVRQEY